MNGGATAPAERPPADLPGLDPRWSRLVVSPDITGAPRTWHVLDHGPKHPVGTVLCVHGNPTWSYLWRSVVEQLGDRWRVIAPDHLGMGFSERTGRFHRLTDRIVELGNLTQILAVTGPVVVVAHDWGGPIAAGWALTHRDDLAALVLTNTAVSQPPGARVPGLIAAARAPGLLRTSTVRTPAFLRGTLRLAHPALPPEVAEAYLAPYRGSERRQAIGDFVDDIPLTETHPSRGTLDDIARELPELTATPALLLWGPRDPVFADRYLVDLQGRLPQAQTHRFEAAGHLVAEDAPVAATIDQWLTRVALGTPAAGTGSPGVGTGAGATGAEEGGAAPAQPSEATHRPLWAAIEERSHDPAPAVIELGSRGRQRTVSFAQLAATVPTLAAGLSAAGVRAGDRVALLVPPGIDLTTALYGCWRAGAVPVIADAGLGLDGMKRALRGAHVQHVIGSAKGLAAARAMRLPGTRFAAGSLDAVRRLALGVAESLDDLVELGVGLDAPRAPGPDDVAAVLFTSGATGPAKGVVYRHRQLAGQRDLIAAAYNLTGEDRLVAAFAPFALYGPALGISSAVPDMDVTSPGTLTASALADAAAAVDATVVFASPAALRGVLGSTAGLDDTQRKALRRVRLLLSAGAPVPTTVLRDASRLLGWADAHTPYGMTEALPVADIALSELDTLLDSGGWEEGVCVGRPLAGVDVTVSPLDAEGRPVGALTSAAGTTGEICVRGPHVKDHYDQLWVTQADSTKNPGWHRTGDVGHLDAVGQLWVEGRLAHVIATADGVVTPVGVERRAEQVDGVVLAAAVGIGPVGTQQVAVVLQTEPAPRHGGLADQQLTDAVREAVSRPVCAVLTVPRLPVDVRHNSKIDRAAVAHWAGRVLAGEKAPRL